MVRRPRLFSDDGASYVADELDDWLKGKTSRMCTGFVSPAKLGKDRPLVLHSEVRILLITIPGDLERQINAFAEHYNHVRYREHRQPHAHQRLFRQRAPTVMRWCYENLIWRAALRGPTLSLACSKTMQQAERLWGNYSEIDQPCRLQCR